MARGYALPAAPGCRLHGHLWAAEEGKAAWVLCVAAAWCQASWVTRDELLELLARLRCAPVGRARLRAPHKPLLLLWLFGRFAATGSTVAAYADTEEPVSALINDFGPPVASAAAARRRAAMPFIHLEREIWDLRDASGAEIGPRVPESGPWLTGHGAVGRLRPQAEQLLGDPATLAAAARRLLDLHFTPGLSGMICDAVGLDLAVLELAGSTGMVVTRRSVRRAGFAEEVLRAYAYQCAMCGFDGALGRNPVGIRRRMCGDNTLMAIALMAQLVALAVAVAELRQAEQHAAQAAAARAAAAHLHSAVTQARSQVPRFGHGQSQRSTRSRSAAENARQDFPTGLSPTQAAAGPARPESSQPDHVSPQNRPAPCRSLLIVKRRQVQ